MPRVNDGSINAWFRLPASDREFIKKLRKYKTGRITRIRPRGLCGKGRSHVRDAAGSVALKDAAEILVYMEDAHNANQAEREFALEDRFRAREREAEANYQAYRERCGRVNDLIVHKRHIIEQARKWKRRHDTVLSALGVQVDKYHDTLNRLKAANKHIDRLAYDSFLMAAELGRFRRRERILTLLTFVLGVAFTVVMVAR